MRFHPRPAAPDLSGLFSPYRHCRAVSFHIPVRHAFHLPVPLCSTPVTALLSSYGDSDSSEGLPPNRGLPASRHTSVETILLPNTPGPPTAAFTRYPSARWVSPYGVQTSPLASRLVGYLRPNRFRLLRTGLSPPVALHLASRRRSYLRLPGRRARAWRGFTPLYVCARGRTSPDREVRDAGAQFPPSPAGTAGSHAGEGSCRLIRGSGCVDLAVPGLTARANSGRPCGAANEACMTSSALAVT